MEIKQAYQYLYNTLVPIYGQGEAASLTRILFEDAFQITNPNKVGDLDEEQAQRFLNYTERFLHREPIQYILGQADFFGLKLQVSPDVLIPRQETEELVAWIIETYRKKSNIRLLDIGTGSGCIPIALKKKLPNLEVWALDVSSAALQISKTNAKKYETDIYFRKLDILNEKLWYTLPSFDCIVSNPPYIGFDEKDKMPDWVLKYEPSLALFSEDPLLFYKKIATFAQQKLQKRGKLFFELNEFNADQVQTILQEKNYTNLELRQDLNGKNRMLKAEKIDSGFSLKN